MSTMIAVTALPRHPDHNGYYGCTDCTSHSDHTKLIGYKNKLIGYADDSILMAVVSSPGVRVTVAESVIRDLVRLVSGVTYGG